MSLAIRKAPASAPRQAPLHRLGAFGEAERDRGLAVEPGDRRTGDQPRLARVFRADAEPRQHRTALRLSRRSLTVIATRHRTGRDGRSAHMAAAARASSGLRASALAQRLGEVDDEGARIAVEDDRAQRSLAGAAVAGGLGQVARWTRRSPRPGAGQAGRADRLEGAGDVEPAVAEDRIDARPRRGRRPSVNRMSTICAPVRLGKACASSATAPVIVGAEKLVPDQRKPVPVWSIVRDRDSRARPDNSSAPVPALFEKIDSWSRSVPPAPLATPTEPAMITLAGNCWAGTSANGSGLLPLPGLRRHCRPK